MLINTNYYSFSNQKISNKKTPLNKTFKAHADFHILMKKNNLLSSSFFRRGYFFNIPSLLYNSIIDTFTESYKNKSFKKMLIAGVANSQEPFSNLAVIKSLNKNKNLEDVVELNIVDLQSKPSEEQLFQDSFYDMEGEPAYVKESFVIDDINKSRKKVSPYRVANDIFKFLLNTYNDSNKSKWDTRFQENVETYADNTFDLVSANNILYYINDPQIRNQTLENIHRILKQGGKFVTDPYQTDYFDRFNIEKFYEVSDAGIYIKK